ncbi:TMEM165/GDT1 family protein [Candidatus Woesearchaeota archaeon]|nr:TMEM165/GDT1 family protein [Candidatus Woesearchaeota archaeon]
MILTSLISSFVLIFLSELADKTQVLILGLSTRFENRMHVFAGVALAHVIMDVIGVVAGGLVSITLPPMLSKLFGIGFLRPKGRSFTASE